MLSQSTKIELIRDLRKSVSEEKQSIARYGKRAAFAARHNLGILREYKNIIKDEKRHYNNLMQEINRIKRLR